MWMCECVCVCVCERGERERERDRERERERKRDVWADHKGAAPAIRLLKVAVNSKVLKRKSKS